MKITHPKQPGGDSEAQPAIKHFKRSDKGGASVSSNGWADMSGYNLQNLPGAEGDIVEIGIQGSWQPGATTTYCRIKSINNDNAEISDGNGAGLIAGGTNAWAPLAGTFKYKLTAADVSAGTWGFKLQGVTDGGYRDMYRCTLMATNYGQPAA